MSEGDRNAEGHHYGAPHPQGHEVQVSSCHCGEVHENDCPSGLPIPPPDAGALPCLKLHKQGQCFHTVECVSPLVAGWYDEQRRADLHANINRGVAEALGQEFGETWHDLPEKVRRLRAEVGELERKIERMQQIIHAADWEQP